MITLTLHSAKRMLPKHLVLLTVLLGCLSVQNTFGKDRTSDSEQVEDGTEFRVLVPQFATEAEAQLGYSVSFALVHEIFRTFNRSTPFHDDGRFDPDKDICCLPKNTVAILDSSLSKQAYSRSFARAKNKQAQIVLWGKAWPYGKDVVVQPFMTIARPPQRLAEPPKSMVLRKVNTGQNQWQWLLWQITAVGEDGSSATVSLTEFPSRRYEMSPIVFDAAKLELFDSFDGLQVYKEKSTASKKAGKTGNKMNATEHAPGGWTKITQPEGWIQLPDLDAADTVEYIGGLVHFMRGNWKRARISFEKVRVDRDAPTQVRRDAALLLAASQYRLDDTCAKCGEPLKFAEGLNPYSETTAKYLFMASLAAARSSNDAGVWQGVVERLDRVRSLAPEDDDFVKNAGEVLDILSSQAGEG